jgi:hypothetical protein
MSVPCYALTISQPYADLIAQLKKWVENRQWYTRYRGILLIHAGSGEQYLTKAEMRRRGLPMSAVVAVCELEDCVDIPDLRARHLRGERLSKRQLEIVGHEYAEGKYGHVYRNVRPVVPPVPCKGKQGFWQPEAITIAEVRQRLKEKGVV